MSSRFNISTLAVVAFALIGCRDSATPVNQTPADFSGVVPPDLSGTVNNTGDGGFNACSKGYTDTTIAAMRAAGTKGCFTLTNVYVWAVNGNSATSSGPYVDVYVQDTAGGDYSAIQAECSLKSGDINSGSGCKVDHNMAKAQASDHQVTIQGHYNKASNGAEYFNIIDKLDDGGSAGSTPPAKSMAPADVARTAALDPKYWYMHAEVSGGPYKLYEFGPLVERNSSSTCAAPKTFGFSIIPSSQCASCTLGVSCTQDGGSPEGLGDMASSNSIIIGTDIYLHFTGSTDCKCAFGTVYAAGTAFDSLKGLLIPLGITSPYPTSVSPISDADLPLSP